jgi:hypothetical protein
LASVFPVEVGQTLYLFTDEVAEEGRRFER